MRHTSTTGSEAPFVAMPFNHEAGPSRHEINGSSRPHGSGANDGKSTGREASGFGAQIVGLCLNDGVDSGTFGQLYQAFLRHQVLLFRDLSCSKHTSKIAELEMDVPEAIACGGLLIRSN